MQLLKHVRKPNAVVREYTVAPIFMKDEAEGGHEWLVDFEKEPECKDQFRTVLDNQLINQNSDYEAKRSSDKVIKKPHLTLAPPKSFYAYLKTLGKLGGQHKIPRLMNNRSYIDALKQFIQETT